MKNKFDNKITIYKGINVNKMLKLISLYKNSDEKTKRYCNGKKSLLKYYQTKR